MTSFVSDTIFMTPAAAITMGLTVAGSWILMRALRTRSSKWLFGLLLASPIWLVFSNFAMDALWPTMANPEHPMSALLNDLWWIPLLGICLLCVSAAVAFLVVTMQIARSNKSFKPTPLRGAA